MASLKSLLRLRSSASSSSSSSSSLLSPASIIFCSRSYSTKVSARGKIPEAVIEEDESEIPTSGICRPLSEILKELSRKVPDSFIKVRSEDGFSIKYVPWNPWWNGCHLLNVKEVRDEEYNVEMLDGIEDFLEFDFLRHIVNRILNLHAPEWSGEVRSITYSADGQSVSVVYRVTLYGTDAEIYRESSGTASVNDTSFGDPVQKAEAMAFRRACARLGLGLHLYHEDLI